MRRWAGLWLGLLSGAALFLSGCGGSASSKISEVRFLQASPDAPPIEVLVDGKVVPGILNYSNASAYFQLQPGSHRIQAVPASGGSSLVDQSISFGPTTTQTFLFAGPAAAIQLVMLTDGGTTSVTGSGYVRVVNASATMGPADVYIVPAGSGIGGVKPVKAALAFDMDTGYQVMVAGNYQVFMTTPGFPNVLLNTGSISLTAAQNQTIVALDGSSGGFQYALLTDQ